MKRAPTAGTSRHGPWAGDLDYASGPWKDPESEAVQLYNCRYQIETQTQA